MSTVETTNHPTEVADLAAAYATGRTPQDLRALHLAVLATPGFDPLVDVAALVGDPEQDPRETLARITSAMPALFLSPDAHAALAAAYASLGAEDHAARELDVARLALGAIGTSGDGTRERPWLVLRVGDEYAWLRSTGFVSTEQRLRTADGAVFDEHLGADGSTVWFRLVGR